MEKISDKIAALPENALYFSLEFFPPKTQMGFSNLQQRLDRMARGLRPLFVTVTWGAGGSTAEKSLELAEICQRQLGLTTCLHLTCTNMSRSLVDEALEQAKALGIRNILALRGDPPRSDEYREEGQPAGEDSNEDFAWAIDLVRYIRKRYGDYFCIGVAGYPEGHADESHPEFQDPRKDIPYLVEKMKAGVDFIMTQLFYDVKAYQTYEIMLRGHESGIFKDIPIIPGLMPMQSYQLLRRTTKLSHAKLPKDILTRLDAVKRDDEAVKRVGVDILCEIIEQIKATKSTRPRGFHFYTLNLEKAVAQVLERCHLIPPSTPNVGDGLDGGAIAIEDNGEFLLVEKPRDAILTKDRRRISSPNSSTGNRVVVDRASFSSRTSYEVPDDEAGIPREKVNSRPFTLAISEGQGTLGREATWDDYPNGRWGDARSPGIAPLSFCYSIPSSNVLTLSAFALAAFGEIDGYGVSLHVSTAQAVKLWNHPTSASDISTIFRNHISGKLEVVPWSEETLSSETMTIRSQLLRLIDKNWWTIASQPAVNGARSTDEVFGWGPKNGFVFQKAFVEFFLSSAEWKRLQGKLADNEEISYFAGNAAGDFFASDEKAVNPVTWGAFKGKEIITPTIIGAVSFKAWLEEAYSIWSEWATMYPASSPTAKLLKEVRDDCWLVNIIHHSYLEKEALWEFLAAA